MTGHTNLGLQLAEARARLSAHRAPIYTGDKVSQAVRSSMRACSMSDEWLRLFGELNRRGLPQITEATP